MSTLEHLIFNLRYTAEDVTLSFDQKELLLGYVEHLKGKLKQAEHRLDIVTSAVESLKELDS